MPKSNSDMIYRLQVALNSKGMRILCNRSQFYSEQQKRPVTIYKITKSVPDEVTGKSHHIELYSTPSQIQCVLFLRNLWYFINDKEIPATNKIKGAIDFEEKWTEFIIKYGEEIKNSL